MAQGWSMKGLRSPRGPIHALVLDVREILDSELLKVIERFFAQDTHLHDIRRVQLLVEGEQCLAGVKIELLRFIPKGLQVSCPKLAEGVVWVRGGFQKLKLSPGVVLEILSILGVDSLWMWSDVYQQH
eukprot:1374230-Amorphochlora_amoeboformis.AAC.2